MKQFIYQFLSKYFLSDCSAYNSLKVRQNCRSKKQARSCFKQLKIPYAKGKIFINPFSVFTFVKRYGFPVVIKPNVGGFSRGAYFPINTKWQLFKASIGVKKWWFSSVIEQYLEGKNYRIVVIKNEVMAIVRRYPPFVIGDGIQNINQLIDEENQLRQTMKIIPEVKCIPKNYAIKKHLKQHNYSLKTILKKQQKIYLHHKISLKLGSVVEVINKEDLSENNKNTLLNILSFFDANILGIDVICKTGLSKDFNQQNCIFLEVNSRPYLKMHDFPRYGCVENLSPFYRQLNILNINNKNTF
jgi:D-alanine-D-alanine ligase-like ATP-grasp enzyme